jgi:hypothetical protein
LVMKVPLDIHRGFAKLHLSFASFASFKWRKLPSYFEEDWDHYSNPFTEKLKAMKTLRKTDWTFGDTLGLSYSYLLVQITSYLKEVVVKVIIDIEMAINAD